ncbi:MAG: L,D-transpeptidase [Candidatus Taylorbacteria bacterium]|nr:L,D-transpeptidase [Candidatus Taylorbacteria bacterium]
MKKITEEKLYRVVAGPLLVIFICVVISVIYLNKSLQDSRIIVATIVEPSTPAVSTTTPTIPKKLYKYIEIIDSCGPYFEEVCVNMRTGHGEQYPVKIKLRNNVVLRVDDEITTANGRDWYKIIFAQNLLFPERVEGDLFVAAEFTKSFYDEGDKYMKDIGPEPITKRIIVDLSEQTLYAYDGDILFMKEAVSTGLKDTPTDVGNFKVYKKTPSRYMQGPIEGVSDQYYDLPGVPWNLYFTYDGNVIHGAYWHDNFGKLWSHGCVNLPPEKARELYKWTPGGTAVIVQE